MVRQDKITYLITFFQNEGEEISEGSSLKLCVDDSSKTDCGPGTVLKNNICELDDRCGPGTILVNGECIVESSPESSSSSKVIGKELIKGIVCAFVISGIVAIFLGIIAKARKKIN